MPDRERRYRGAAGNPRQRIKAEALVGAPPDWIIQWFDDMRNDLNGRYKGVGTAQDGKTQQQPALGSLHRRRRRAAQDTE